MKMVSKKIIKIFTVCLMTVLLSGFISLSVYAEEIMETEPNDTKEAATLIKANKQTAQEFADVITTRKYGAGGSSSKTDPDWFKVYLDAGDQYLTCYNCTFAFVAEDEAGNTLLDDMHMSTGYAPIAYMFKAPTAGYYYIKILASVSSSSKRYSFVVGNPTYAFSTCEISCDEGAVNMTYNEKIKEAHFDGKKLKTLPKDAIAYSVKISGIKSTLINGVRLVNEERDINFPLRKYIWSQDNLASLDMPVESLWTAKLEYSKASTFTPTLEMRYIYSVYTTWID